MKVDLERLAAIKAELEVINSVPLDKIEWYRGGHKIQVSQEAVETWISFNMSNEDFPSLSPIPIES
jgi:hypothetical protein